MDVRSLVSWLDTQRSPQCTFSRFHEPGAERRREAPGWLGTLVLWVLSQAGTRARWPPFLPPCEGPLWTASLADRLGCLCWVRRVNKHRKSSHQDLAPSYLCLPSTLHACPESVTVGPLVSWVCMAVPFTWRGHPPITDAGILSTGLLKSFLLHKVFHKRLSQRPPLSIHNTISSLGHF